MSCALQKQTFASVQGGFKSGGRNGVSRSELLSALEIILVGLRSRKIGGTGGRG